MTLLLSLLIDFEYSCNCDASPLLPVSGHYCHEMGESDVAVCVWVLEVGWMGWMHGMMFALCFGLTLDKMLWQKQNA